MKTLVIGATGNTCSFLIPNLIKTGKEIRAFVRNREKAREIEKAGAEIYVGDLDHPGTIDDALKGIDQVYLCTWNGPTAQQQGLNVIEAIKRSGSNPLVVRHSAFGSDGSRIIQQIDEVDQVLRDSGCRWTSIKPTFYMQNLMMAIQTIQSDGKIYWDWSDGKVGMVDVRDVADSALGALSGRAEEGKEYILTGPESISMQEVARVFTNILNKQVNYVPVPHETSREGMMSMGFSPFIVDGYIELNEGFSGGFADTTTENVEKLAGHPARSLKDFIQDYKEYFESNN